MDGGFLGRKAPSSETEVFWLLGRRASGTWDGGLLAPRWRAPGTEGSLLRDGELLGRRAPSSQEEANSSMEDRPPRRRATPDSRMEGSSSTEDRLPS
ncbi:hypothetical protein Nepgr_021319 [Nepenthes gracilis]|uniref:Uncharacterized protein n=1 Tax=Nepenthes gracilis TaxID=150966 RepID=A0AAD3SXY5_NEPGR|nr:hypothetical protein Nepgr_021319 [Nepenthes gracilis]